MAIEEKNIKPEKNAWFSGKVLATVLLTKILIFWFAVQSYQIVTNRPLNGFYDFFNNWKRWDAEHYLKIAQNGYTTIGEDRFLIVFFPFYPSLIALFQIICRDYLISGFIVSGIASLALGFVFRELVRLDYSEKIAQFSVLFLFIFPTAYFLHIPYTESLFLALTIGCFLAARRRSWILVGILGFLACLTRVNGLILLPALAFEAWNEFRETKVFNRRWLALIIVPLGFAVYLFINYIVAGNLLMFMIYQREHWYREFRFPLFSLYETALKIYYDKPNSAQMTGVQELLFVLIGLFAIAAGWRYLRNSYRVWMICNWLLFISTSFILSVPRYTLVMFPLFILMSLAAARNWWAQWLFVVWSILFLGLFALQFFKGSWAF